MSLLDKFRSRTGALKHKAGGLAHDHGDKIGGGLDKASGAVNKATRGRFEDKIDKATGKAKEGVDKLGHRDDEPGTSGTPGDDSGPATPGDAGPDTPEGGTPKP